MSSTTRMSGAEVPEANITGSRLSGGFPERAVATWHNAAVPTSMFAFGAEDERWDELDWSPKSFAAPSVGYGTSA